MAVEKSAKAGGVLGKVRKMSWKAWVAVLVVLALLAGGAYFAYQYNEAKKEAKAAQAEADKLKDPQQAARAQTEQLVADVGKLVQLPTGETPTVATVSDVSKLKSQAFFAKAQNGDKVLIYTEAKRAILYRPSTNKVIEIAPVNLGNNSSNSSSNSP